MRASIAVAVAVAVAGCFNPTFNNPACGPQGECPPDHTCVQGVCRAQADPVDAPASDGIDPVDGPPSDGTAIDGPPGGGCQPAMCGATQFACGNCIDDDGDSLIDADDPDCLGACDHTESSILVMGFPGDVYQCPVDLYFDGNTGAGDDGCRWDLRCYMQGGYPTCPFNSSMLGTNNCPNNQSSSCVNMAAPLTPNGCDCFGCCQTPDGSRHVWIGARDTAGMGTCSFSRMNDVVACPTCTPQMSCYNGCTSCEVCAGRALPAACGGVQTCAGGAQSCGQSGQPSCPMGQYCITGCCQPTPP